MGYGAVSTETLGTHTYFTKSVELGIIVVRDISTVNQHINKELPPKPTVEEVIEEVETATTEEEVEEEVLAESTSTEKDVEEAMVVETVATEENVESLLEGP